jgi:phosphoglycolate phosphatase-like HAD superfamily hydrolase
MVPVTSVAVVSDSVDDALAARENRIRFVGKHLAGAAHGA